MIRSYPLAGTVAVVLALATLVAEAALLIAPDGPRAAYDPTDLDGLQLRAARARAVRLERFETGLAVLGMGSALAGFAALSATGRGNADRALAGVAGVCFLASVAVWLVLAATIYRSDTPWDSDDRRPALVIQYDT